MSMTERLKFFHVNLEFPLEHGTMHWVSQVAADDEEGAVKMATNTLWSQMDYNGVKPKVKVAECYEVEGHLADPLSHDTHAE